jgi:DNA-binding MarR family transcriptional regulator
MVDVTASAELLESIELFYFGYRAFTSKPDGVLEQRGLGRVHHRILYFVGRNPLITVNELLETLQVSKQALNAPLRQLLEMNLVAYSVPAHDRRVKQLSLTAEGQRLEGRLTATQVKHLKAAFAQAGEPAAQAWRKVMREVAAQD